MNEIGRAVEELTHWFVTSPSWWQLSGFGQIVLAIIIIRVLT